MESVERLLAEGGWDADVRVVREAIEALSAMPVWVKRSERMPGDGDAVYICHLMPNGRAAVSEACWNGEHDCWDDADGDDHFMDCEDATHWMLRNIPAPPQSTDIAERVNN